MAERELSMEYAMELCQVQSVAAVAPPGSAPSNAEWPRMMYHQRLAPKGQVFASEADFASAEAGWKETP